MIKQYKPVACSLHDRYEIAIMRKARINIAWIDENGIDHEEIVMPVDIVVKNSAEFLLFLDEREDESLIRPDHITLFDDSSRRLKQTTQAEA